MDSFNQGIKKGTALVVEKPAHEKSHLGVYPDLPK